MIGIMADRDTPDEDRKYRAPALEKGLDVLELLAAHGAPMTASEMSAELDRSVSELFRMIQVLEFRGYIEQSPEGYQLTNRLFTLGMSQEPVKTLVETALPLMRELSVKTVQSCHLVLPTDTQIVVVARIESPGDLGYAVRLGYRRNMIDATSGRLFYAMAASSARKQLKASLIAQHGAARFKRFERDAEAATQQRYVERASDFVKGVIDLAAPIMGADGVIAVLITPFIERIPPTCDTKQALAELSRTAAAISNQMGATTQA